MELRTWQNDGFLASEEETDTYSAFQPESPSSSASGSHAVGPSYDRKKPPLTTPPRIHLVEDEEDLRIILRVLLERRGYIVTESKSGNEAWTALAQKNVDLVISDIRMPDGDGFSLLDQIHKRNSKRPHVILMTGYCDISEADAMSRGTTAVFGKPFDCGRLLQAVQDTIASAQRA